MLHADLIMMHACSCTDMQLHVLVHISPATDMLFVLSCMHAMSLAIVQVHARMQIKQIHMRACMQVLMLHAELMMMLTCMLGGMLMQVKGGIHICRGTGAHR